jgi:hypothetical protein
MADFQEKWRHFHDNTYFRLNSEPTAVFTHPWFLQKSFPDNIVLVVLNRFLNFFRYKFSTFDHLDKDTQSYILFSTLKDDKQILKPQEMWEKTRLEYGF